MLKLDEWVTALVVDPCFLLLIICDLSYEPIEELAVTGSNEAEGARPVRLEAYN